MSTRISKPYVSLSVVLGTVLFFATAAHAQLVRYIATDGDNQNVCTRIAPCRTLDRGITMTPDGGELQILDSGTFGNAATIDKAITISAAGVAATVGAITINAPGAAVVLRGLLLTGRNAALSASGIQITAAAAVHVVRCEIERFAGGANGIRIDADNAAVFISDSIVRNNGFDGILLTASSTGVQLAIDNSRVENNGSDGIEIVGAAETTITRVVTSRNGRNGITSSSGRMNVTATTSANNENHGYRVDSASQMTLDTSLARGNAGVGLIVNSGGIGRITNSVFTNNPVGLWIDGSLLSRGNNTVSGNSTNTNGTVTAMPGI